MCVEINICLPVYLAIYLFINSYLSRILTCLYLSVIMLQRHFWSFCSHSHKQSRHFSYWRARPHPSDNTDETQVWRDGKELSFMQTGFVFFFVPLYHPLWVSHVCFQQALCSFQGLSAAAFTICCFLVLSLLHSLNKITILCVFLTFSFCSEGRST